MSSFPQLDRSPGDDDTSRLLASCALFEERWRQGSRPDIAEFLERTEFDDRATLLMLLIRIDVRERLRRGESPKPHDYVTRFPHDSGTILEIDWLALTGNDSARGSDPLASTRHFAMPRRSRIGRFELLERIGTGGFGEVWKALDTQLQREVAIKFGHFGADDTEQLEMLLHEARSAGCLKHPGIVSIHEAAVEDGIAYIVSDFIDGRTLGEMLKAGRLPLREAARIAALLADAVTHAHDRGIIHRDIKPANVLIDASGNPHLTDFGVARRASGGMTISKDGHALGTPAYMAPEQANFKPGQLDHRADIYAVGLLLYEMLAGRRAYPGDAREALQRVLLGPPQRLRLFRQDVPRALETIVEVAIARNRDDRYASAAALSADLNRYLQGESILATLPGAIKRLRRRLRPRRPMAIAVAVIALLAATGLVVDLPKVGSGHVAVHRDSSVLQHALEASESHRHLPAPPGSPADSRLRRVLVETRPPGAKVWLFPLDENTFWPKVDQRIDLESPSPGWAVLAPGNYLVVADLGGSRFNEVTRWIPEPNENAAFSYDNMYWTSLDDGTIGITLPIPSPPGDEYFTDYAANEQFLVNDANGRQQVLSIPGFRLARQELSNHLFATPEGEKRDAILTSPPGHAAVLRYDEAASGLERLGMRLPDEWEWEYAARFDAPDLTAIADQTALVPDFGRVGFPAADRMGPHDGVYGLFSNVAELTSSSPIPPWESAPPSFSTMDFRIVRGGDEQVQAGNPIVNAKVRDPRGRYPVRLSTLQPGIGVRGARSMRPRRTAEDFIRHLGTIETPADALGHARSDPLHE